MGKKEEVKRRLISFQIPEEWYQAAKELRLNLSAIARDGFQAAISQHGVANVRQSKAKKR